MSKTDITDHLAQQEAQKVATGGTSVAEKMGAKISADVTAEAQRRKAEKTLTDQNAGTINKGSPD